MHVHLQGVAAFASIFSTAPELPHRQLSLPWLPYDSLVNLNDISEAFFFLSSSKKIFSTYFRTYERTLAQLLCQIAPLRTLGTALNTQRGNFENCLRNEFLRLEQRPLGFYSSISFEQTNRQYLSPRDFWILRLLHTSEIYFFTFHNAPP
jgi:hypothetical protein